MDPDTGDRGTTEGRGEPEGAPDGGDRGGSTGSAEGPRPDDAGPIGPFPSWASVYVTVLAYGVAMILFLWVLTRLLDPAVTP